MFERTLRLRGHLDRPRAEPGFAGWLSGLLRLESEVYSTRLRIWVQFRPFAFECSNRIVQASEFFGLGFLPFRDFIRSHQWRKMRGTFLLFAARKSPLRAFHDSIKCIVISG